tara:strand:+ start:1893 stop:2363 length:471 start_codon:yes stop_codon:yes gene_type:complete
MEKEIQKILSSYARNFSKRLKQGLKTDGTNASGNTVNSVKHYAKGDSAYISYSGVAGIVSDGIRAGISQPEVRTIMDWMKRKGITPQANRSLRDSAYLITRAIKKNGTIKRRGYGGTGILERLANDRTLINKLQSDLSEVIGEEVFVTTKINITTI